MFDLMIGFFVFVGGYTVGQYIAESIQRTAKALKQEQEAK